jgi:hypothetical protein
LRLPRFVGFVLFFGLVACHGAGPPKPPVYTPLLPADYASTYQQVRPCKESADHDLNNVTVLADPAAFGPYTTRTGSFPVGATVVKQEHDMADENCTGNIVQWTIMVKLADGSSPSTLDWTWQNVLADRSVQTQNDKRCISCHSQCGEAAAGGFMSTCSQPPMVDGGVDQAVMDLLLESD